MPFTDERDFAAEAIFGVVGFQLRLQPYYFFVTTDTAFFRDETGLPIDRRTRADVYFWPEDGAGPIMILLGRPKKRKNPWAEWYAPEDGQPFRVMYVSFEGDVEILNPRYTEFERELIKLISLALMPRKKKKAVNSSQSS